MRCRRLPFSAERSGARDRLPPRFAREELQHVAGNWFSDENRVVVLTHLTVGGEEADAADVLTYRDGKLVKFQTAGDTALLERVFGSNEYSSEARRRKSAGISRRHFTFRPRRHLHAVLVVRSRVTVSWLSSCPPASSSASLSRIAFPAAQAVAQAVVSATAARALGSCAARRAPVVGLSAVATRARNSSAAAQSLAARSA